jgi:hydroxyacylglutathione hydrolase
MGVFIQQIPNAPIDSNSFVVYTKTNLPCIVIDPGTENCKDLIEFLEGNKLRPDYIFLTHEHFDHIWGINTLKDIYNSKIVSSDNGAQCIIYKKKNMSVFYDQIGFETYPADIKVEEIDYKLDWAGIKIEFITTKGHTDASICIFIENNLFTGDTIIKNIKTVIKLPGGSKVKLLESISLLDNKFRGKQIMVHPGHGESFWYDEIKKQELI